MRKIMAVFTVFLVCLVVGCGKSNIDKEYNFVTFNGKPNSTVAWFSIGDDNFIPVEGKTGGSLLKEGYKMADKPAIAFSAEAINAKNEEPAMIEMTFNKAPFKEGAVLRSIKSFKEHKNKTLDGSVIYKNEKYNCSMYDTFDDTFLEVKINSIKDSVAEFSFSGKLYNNKTDKKSIKVTGKGKLKL